MKKLTADEARALLNIHWPDDQDNGTEAEAFLWSTAQSAIMKGERSAELADLHTKATFGDREADKKAEAIVRELHAAVEAELEQRLADIADGKRRTLWTR